MILKGLDKIMIHQIRFYQTTERFVRVGLAKPKPVQSQTFEVIKEVEESFVSEESDVS